jgi:flagellar hook protein FlgE
MSISNSLFTGASGLGAHGDAISIVGDNIANASTTGFKSSRASFEDVLGGTGANGQRYGNGVRMSGAEVQFGQGSIQQTGRPLDFAVRGNGFFVVAGNHDGQDGSYYTRDGDFQLDNTGTVIDGEGLKLQGYLIDAQGNVSNSLGDLAIGGQSAPNATTKLSLKMNLDSGAATPAAAWDPANPTATSSYQTSATVYDSLGATHRVDLYFRNDGAGSWEYHAMVDGGDVTGGTKGTPTEIAAGTLAFDGAGALQTTAVTTPASASFIGATANQAIAFDFGDPTATGGTGRAGVTQDAGASSVTGLTQDGFAAGELSDITTDNDGTITGVFSNGQSRPIARLALATFQDNEGLRRAGNQLFSETRASGQPLVGQAGSGSRGAISSGSLESSNVDLSNELVTMIAYQRAFQANAKTITTADDMLAEVSNLKR